MPMLPIPAAREIALMLSRRCNIACHHCGIESSPHVKDRMTREDATRFIVEAAAKSDFQKVTFTGGEPMLFEDDLEALIGLCESMGLETRIVTNGYWARDVEKGVRRLARLRDAGLSELNFSADIFHLDFLAAQTLRNAFEVAGRLRFNRIVSFVSKGQVDPFDDFCNLYGIPRASVVDLREVLTHRPDMLRTFHPDAIFVYYGALIGLGRAREHPEHLNFYPLDYFAESPCGEVVNKPVIYPDGSFQACCCAGGKIGSFTVGNAFETPVHELYERMQQRSHFRLINTHGPRTLFNCVREARPDLNLPEQYTSICELCVRATDQLSADEVDAIADRKLLLDTLEQLRAVSPRV